MAQYSVLLTAKELSYPERVSQFLLAVLCLLAGALFSTAAAEPLDAQKVLEQSGAGFPATWGNRDAKPVPAAYTLKIDATLRSDFAKGLRSLPTLSIKMDVADLFGAERGIYANPTQTGAEWERRASVEYIQTNQSIAYRVDCGIRIQGGWNRRPEESPKHAFRLVFKKKYGEGKWRHPLFDGAEPREFDELILRAGCNNSWLHWSGEERRRGDYIRDQWMRDSYRAMGHPSARGEFVHLFLNGLYWGVYNLAERPTHDFAAAHFGGKPSEYDARNADNILSGDTNRWSELFRLANGGVANEKQYEAIANLLDLPAFADYMLLNLYGGNGDWDRASNWYAAARRNPSGKFHFFVWDAERTLEDPQSNVIASDDDQSPTRLFQKLRENEGFRKLFNERARLHFAQTGALSSANAARRYQGWADRLRQPIVCEAARWGAYRHDVHQYKTGPYEVYTRDAHWTPEVQRITTEFFSRRPEVFLRQLRETGF